MRGVENAEKYKPSQQLNQLIILFLTEVRAEGRSQLSVKFRWWLVHAVERSEHEKDWDTKDLFVVLSCYEAEGSRG